MKRVVVATIAGVAVTALTLLALGEIGEDRELAMALTDSGGVRLAVVWYTLLGIGLGLVILAARYHPLVPGIPAVLLFAVYHLPIFLGRFPTWYPSWLRRAYAFGHPTAYVIVGVLAAASLWPLVHVLRRAGSAREPASR